MFGANRSMHRPMQIGRLANLHMYSEPCMRFAKDYKFNGITVLALSAIEYLYLDQSGKIRLRG